jgi:multiple sugar transport system substrate-binding protein
MAGQLLSFAGRGEHTQNYLSQKLAEFDRASQSQTQMRLFSWAEIWGALREIALAKTGADVSEVGTTWIESLARMTALRPFSPREVTQIMGTDDYLPLVWKSATVVNDPQIWAIPWLTDARFIYYWRDMLEDAGVDETTAFQTHEATVETLERLRAAGIDAPWAAPTTYTNNTLWYLASWIWGMGGDFLAEDGKSTLLGQRETLNGIRAYYNLERFLPRSQTALSERDNFELFIQRQTATLLLGRWLPTAILARTSDKSLLDNLGVALPPGPPFVGGSNLVIWRHTSPRTERAALAAVEFLMSPEVQREYSLLAGVLPTRISVLSEAPFSTDQHYKIFIEGLKRGRTLPTVSLWGIVEENLVSAFEAIWRRIRQHPEQAIDDIIIEHLEPLAVRLDRTLSQI